jgi:hypothetical protein
VKKKPDNWNRKNKKKIKKDYGSPANILFSFEPFEGYGGLSRNFQLYRDIKAPM